MDLSRSAASEDLAVMAAIASQTVRKWGSQPIADAAALAKGSNFLADSALYQDKGSEEHRRVRTVDHAIQVRAAAVMQLPPCLPCNTRSRTAAHFAFGDGVSRSVAGAPPSKLHS